MSHCHKDPLDCNEVSPQATPGGLYEWKGALYRYVKFLDAVTYVVGHTLTMAATDGTSVTNDTSGGSSVAPLHGVGVCQDIMTENYYGYMMVRGTCNVVCDGSVAADDAVVAGTDGVADTMAAGEEHLAFGHALMADDGSPALALCEINCN